MVGRVMLNSAIYLNTLRSHVDTPVRLVIAGFLLLLLYLLVSGGVSVNATTMSGIGSLVMGGNSLLSMLVWLLGLGLISRDIASGSIQLVLLRPLSRASYVLSKWAALTSVGLIVLVMMYGTYLARHTMTIDSTVPLILLFAAQCVQVAAIAAVITLFSTVPMKFGEFGLLILSALLLLTLQLLNLRYGVAILDAAVTLAWRILLPNVTITPAFANGAYQELIVGMALNSGVAVVGVAGAVGLMRWREFTYAEQGG